MTSSPLSFNQKRTQKHYLNLGMGKTALRITLSGNHYLWQPHTYIIVTKKIVPLEVGPE